MVKKAAESTLDEQRTSRTSKKDGAVGSSVRRRWSSAQGRPSQPAAGMAQITVPAVDDAMKVLQDSSPAIPASRPVTGRDLNLLRTRLGGITVTDACWLFGLQRNRWYTLTKSEKPLEDVSLAILVRFYDLYPEFCPVKPAPKAQWVFEWLKQLDPMLDQRSFSLLLGREKSAAHRWLKMGAAVSPKVERLFTGAHAMLTSKVDAVDVLERLVKKEAEARGLDISEGAWSTEDARIKPKRRKAGERGEVEKREKAEA